MIDATPAAAAPRPLRRGLSNQELAALCHRLSTSLDAGIDIRRIWQSETERARGRTQRVYQTISEAVSQGVSLGEAIAPWNGFFPQLLVTLVGVGETTGSTPSVLKRLADHYEHRVRVARDFRSQIAWPLFQLLMALVVVGVLILIAGVLKDGRGQPIDLLGFGLVGSPGLLIYGAALGSLVLGVLVLLQLISRRPEWSETLLAKATHLPILGECFQKIALARIAWALHLTMNVEIDLRRLAPLVLAVSGNRHYSRYSDAVAADIGTGMPLSVAFTRTGVFPRRFLDALAVAEESGMIVESMARLSQQYEEESESALATLNVALGFVVWAAVATLVVLLIFRIFGFYTGAIHEALDAI